MLGQEEGEGGFGYDWLNGGGEVRLYRAKEGDKTVVVDTQGKEAGTLEVGGDGEAKGLDILKGDWKVSKFG